MSTDNNYTLMLPSVGDHINDNIIIEMIAEGGMACIYKVKNEALEVIRVIKIMKTTSNLDADRFVTEARIHANLNHPNVVQCYSFGKYKNSIPYIEMEYVDGINLHQLISQRGKIPPQVCAAIIFYICKALDTLHSCDYVLYGKERAGVVHRDIKPANILISKDGNLKLADFGIAKPRDLSKHTSSVHVIGSSFYISPEQFQKKKLDFRADIYSLGCVIFEMVTGCKAFDYDNISDLVMAKMNNSYNEALLYDCPEKFVSIISQCIQPLKEDRFANIEEVLTAVESELKYYSINDPRHLIRDYVDSPDTISFPAAPPKKRRPVRYLIVLFSVPLFIIILFLIIFLKKSSKDYSQVKTDKLSTPVVEIVKDTVVPELLISTEPAKIPEIAKPIAPIKKEEALQDLITLPDLKPEIPEKASVNEGYDAFMRKEYDKCISILSGKKDLCDMHTLCYLGSLLETGKLSKLSELIDKKAVSDGYYFYIKGRAAFYNKDYNGSNEYFVKALTAKSFYKNLQLYSNYYIAKSRTSVFLEKPNTVNKNIMHKSQERFLANFCQDAKSFECNDIKTLSEKYK